MNNADRLASHLRELKQALDDATAAGKAAWASANVLTAELIATQAELATAQAKLAERRTRG